MPKNPNRTIERSEKYGAVGVDFFSTGTATLYHEGNRRQILLNITKAQELVEQGYIEKLAHLLKDDDVSWVVSASRSFTQYSFAPTKLLEGFTTIMDSELDSESKLIYLLSFGALQVPFTAEDLNYIFSKRPKPRELWESSAITSRLPAWTLIRNSLTPGFYGPQPGVGARAEEFKRAGLISAFHNSEISITYGDFLERHQSDYFINHFNPTPSGNLFRALPKTSVADLYPAEFSRFMEHFARECPPALIPWARRRFDSGIETLGEHRNKGQAVRVPFSLAPFLNFLTPEEYKKFSGDARDLNVDASVGALLAYYFVEGGMQRFNELVAHIRKNQPAPTSHYSKGALKRNWKNPLAVDERRLPNLKPYVQALEGDMAEFPLELSLATL